ncbi:MAG: Na(+)/H(+) antiporter subunit B [Desulfatiglandaceae bacterium]
MKFLGIIVVVITGALLVYTTGDFPSWSDPASPASTHVSPHYIEKGMHETAAPNIVTAVLADYRGFDTLFETTVVFCAGVVCFFLLRIPGRSPFTECQYRHKATGITVRVKHDRKMSGSFGEFERIDTLWTPHDLIIQTACRILIPFIQLFALYVIAHGHHSPGGGFQGGVILGASIILLAISHDLRTALDRLGEKAHAILCSVGVLVYAGTGALCMVLGFNFLDYGALARILHVDPVMARSHGILVVEVGVGLAVMAALIWIYSNVSSRGNYDEGL